MIETPADILAHEASRDAADAFVAYRKGMGKRHALTVRAAALIGKSLRTIREQGGCPDEALDMAQERSWMTVKPAWFWSAKQQEGRALRVVSDNDNRYRHALPAAAGDKRTAAATDAADRCVSFAARAGRTPRDDCF